MKIPLSSIIAFNNPEGAIKVLQAYGYEVETDDPHYLQRGLSHLLQTFGESGLSDLAKVHPDRELITRVNDVTANAGENKSNACGCSGFSSCDGCGGGCGGSNFHGPWNRCPGQSRAGLIQYDVYGFTGKQSQGDGYGILLLGGIALAFGLMFIKEANP
ncbi:MAG TPA: hypothetical protein PKZ07_14620 [Sedimentisphaerales bacterium]|nr:hypothetical protein [Sedimentisphaerales bacterium]